MGTVHTFPHDDNATPTTRLIRNCEAVGLFNDLPPNPFEETFRMAAASDLTQLLKEPLIKKNSEETLNTPHVLTSTASQSYQSCSRIDDDDDVIVLNDFLEPILPESNHISSSPNANNSNDSSDVEIIENPPEEINPIAVERSVPVCNSNSNINIENIIFTVNDNALKSGNFGGFFLGATTPQSNSNIHSVNLNMNKQFKSQKSFIVRSKESKLATSTLSEQLHENLPAETTNTEKNSNILYKLSGTNLSGVLSGKNVVILPSRNRSKPLDKNFPELVVRSKVADPNSNADNDVKQKLKNYLKNNSNQNHVELSMREESSETFRDSNSVSSVEDEKKEYSRERNRMAQKRCRMKKKKWIMQLKNETECVTNENQKLLSLIDSLRAEIAHLKTLLLAHRNCSVTRAMYKADLNAIINNEVSEIVEDIEIPASNDADDQSSSMQITYRQHYNKVHNQQVNQVNHFHVHVPASPELNEKMLNFAPDSNHMEHPLDLPRKINILNSKFNVNKKLICDSKVVPIKADDRVLKKSVNAVSTHAVSESTNDRKPMLKIFISGNKTSFAEVSKSTASTLPSPSSSNGSKQVIQLNKNFTAAKIM